MFSTLGSLGVFRGIICLKKGTKWKYFVQKLYFKDILFFKDFSIFAIGFFIVSEKSVNI